MKGREATSEVERIRAYAFVERTLPFRFETPINGKVALVAQHFHEMNPRGYLLGEATDRHLNLSAIAVRKLRAQETLRDWIEPV